MKNNNTTEKNKMTGEEFVKIVEIQPDFCKNLTEPLEVTTYVDLYRENITHLSPLITFSGDNGIGCAAHFHSCKNLKIATGTYEGWVYFGNSGVEKIENLIVTGTDRVNNSASFYGCKNLKVATGNYEGFVNFSKSGVETIKDLNAKETCFVGCKFRYLPRKYRLQPLKEINLDEEEKEKWDNIEILTRNTINQLKQEDREVWIEL